jgi:hypothetical protein
MPIDNRLIPACLYWENFSCSKVPGLASSVISQLLYKFKYFLIWFKIRSILSALNKLGVPPPKKMLLIGRVSVDSASVSLRS